MTYEIEESFTENIIIKDANNVKVDPSTILIYIRKPNGTIDVDGIAMTNDGVGEYSYRYIIPTQTGEYLIKLKATSSSSDVVIKTDGFEAIKSI